MLRSSLNELRIPGGARVLAPDRNLPAGGQGKEGQVAAVSAYVPGRWRQRPQAAGPPGAPDTVLGRAAPLPSAGAAPPVRLCALCAPWARPGLGSGPAAVRTMTLPRARAAAWAAAARAAQRRRRVEGAGRSPRPVTRSQRAALYVHVSGEESTGRLVSRDPTPRPSPLRGEVLARTLPWQGDVRARGPEVLVLASAVTLDLVAPLLNPSFVLLKRA